MAAIAAYTASCRIREVIMIPLGAVPGAGSTFVGQNYGAKKFDRIAEANRKMLGIEFLWFLISLGIVWIFGRPLVVWTTAVTNETLITGALLNLQVSAACFFPLGALFVLRYSMQAMGHKVLPVLSSSIELGVKIVSGIVIVPAVGYLGAVAAEPVTWCICAAFLGVFYVTVGHHKHREPGSAS